MFAKVSHKNPNVLIGILVFVNTSAPTFRKVEQIVGRITVRRGFQVLPTVVSCHNHVDPPGVDHDKVTVDAVLDASDCIVL